MTNRLVSASLPAKLAIAVSISAFTALVAMLANVDNALTYGFQAALAQSTTSVGSNIATIRNAPVHLVKNRAATNTTAQITDSAADYAMSEDFWLGHAGRTKLAPVAWTNSPRIGDTVTISTKTGKRVLRIESIASLPTLSVSPDTQKQSPPLFVVTAREAGRTDGVIVRMLVEDATNARLSRNKVAVDRNL